MIVEPTDKETVTTWANGFGRWFAKVEFPTSGYGPQHLEANIDRIRAKARRAIRREINARQELTSDYFVYVQVEESDIDSLNVMHSITYGEVL